MIVLDTHALVWWVNDQAQLSAPARDAIHGAAEEGLVYVSSISIWEVALLIRKGRLTLSMETGEWVRYCESLPELIFVPVSNSIGLQAVELPPPLHADPADRIIVATARALGAPLATRDERIQAYPHVRSIW